MPNDTLTFSLNWLIFLVYSVIFIISLIFTFSLETYRKIDEKLSSDLVTLPVISVFDKDIEWIDFWLMSHNKIAGPILAVLAVTDLKLYFDIINRAL
jgi:hypothetical protein